MPLALPIAQAVSGALLLYATVSAGAGWWVYEDGRARLGRRRWETVGWAVGTLVALPIFLPIYLLGARPPGQLIRCPHCGSATLSHRAVCLHCEHPVPFDAPPMMWGVGEVVGLGVIFIVTLPLVAYAAGIGGVITLGQLSFFAVVQTVLFVTLSIYVVRFRYRRDIEALGLRRTRWPELAAVGLVLGAVMIPVSTLVERASIFIIGAFTTPAAAQRMADVEHFQDPVAEVLQVPLAIPELVWMLVLVCVVVPVGEEIFFRGFVYGALRRWGAPLATLLSALFFAAVHQQVVHFLPIFVLGVVLAMLYARTASLLPSILVHAVNNLVATLAVLYGWNI